jgi:hypothetical protein
LFFSLFLLAAGMVSSFALPGHYFLFGFLTSERGTFDDFFADRAEQWGTYELISPGFGALPPIAAGLGSVWGLLPPWTALVCFVAGTLGFSHAILSAFNVGPEFHLFLLLSYPTLFAVSRGNNDLYLIPIVLLWALLMQQERFGLVASTAAFAFALEPVMLSLVIISFFSAKRVTVVWFAGSSIAFWLSPVFFGERNLQEYFFQFLNLLEVYRQNYIIGDGGLLFSNSLWGLFKTAIWAFDPVAEVEQRNALLEAAYSFYPALLAISLVALAAMVFSGMNWRRALAYVAVVIVALGPVSATYKLVLLTVAMIVLYAGGQRFNRIELSLWVLALSPKAFIVVSTASGVPVTMDTVVNPLVLLVIMVLLIKPELRKILSKAREVETVLRKRFALGKPRGRFMSQ